MDDVDAVARPKAKGKPEEETEDIGTVADFIELINTTVGKHFKCCICFSILEDPVMLPCNHPLCRGCATQCLRQNQRCPQCLAPIPNLRMLQGRNTWIAEMVGSLKNCLNEVGVSLTQHAPVPPKYRDKSPPKTGAAGAAVRQRARARARASSGDANRAQLSAVSCGGGGGGGGGGGSSSSGGRRRGGARQKASGRSGNGAGSRTASASTRTQSTSPNSSNDENAEVVPVPPSSPSPSPPAPAPAPRRFVIGDLVFVEHRTWPGMNKHGGVALVTAVLDPPGSRYDVKYTVSRKHDRGVEARYVHEFAFPEETVGSRSRRGGGGTRAGGHPGGSSGSSRIYLPPRGRSRTPVSAPAASAATSTTNSSAVTTVASPVTTAAASPVPNPSPPRHEHAVDNGGEALGAAEDDGPGREPAVSAATAAASPASAAAADAIAVASSPPAATAPVAASDGSERVESHGGDTEVLGHGDDDDDGDESRCDDATEGSHHSDADADAASTIREEDAERDHANGDADADADADADGDAGGAEYSSDDGGGMDDDYGGGSYDDGHDNDDVDVADGGDDSDTAAPMETEGNADGDGEAAVPAEALSPPGVAEKETDEGGKGRQEDEEEATRIEEIKDLTDDAGKSLSQSEAGSGIAGGAADGPAAPLSPSSRSNLPWCPPQSEGLGNERRQRRRHDHDPPASAPASDTRDAMLAGAAEGLMALAANPRTAPAAAAAAAAGVEDAEEEPRIGNFESGSNNKGGAETSTSHPQSPGDRTALDHGSGSPAGASLPPAGPSLPPGSPAAASAPSSLLPQPGSDSCSDQHQDDAPVASAAAAAAAAGDNRQDDGGDNLNRTPSTCSMETVEGIGAGTLAETPANSAPSPLTSTSTLTASQPSHPSARPALSGLTPPALLQTPRQAMPPPPPLFPSPTLPRPSSSSLPPPPPKTPPFKVGDLVSVPSRSSPGVNKEGGVAKVTLARPDGTFDVKYIVRQGREKSVAAAILSPYKVDDDDGGGGGDGAGSGNSSRQDSGERGVAAAARGPSPSVQPPSMARAARGGGGGGGGGGGSGSGGSSGVRRTPRSNKGWCSPDIAAGQANAACLNYMLGDTQHPELDLDPDLGELLDPNEGTNSSSGSSSGVKSVTGAPTGKARRQRETSSSAAAAAAAAAAVITVEDGDGSDSDDGNAVSGWELRGSSDGGRRKNKNRGSGNKRKRPARGSGDESDETGGNGNETHTSGGSQGGSSQGQGRRRRRRSSSEGSSTGSGDGSKNDVFDITALTADSDSEDNAATRLVAAAVEYDGAKGSSGHEVFDIAALSPVSDVAESGAPAAKKRSRSSGGRETPRAAAAAATEAVGQKRGLGTAAIEAVGQKRGLGTDKGKSKAVGGKAGGSRSRGGGGISVVDEKVGSVNGGNRRGRAMETEKPVVLTLSGSTPEMLTVANGLVKSLGWRVEPKYTEAVTHVVCGTVQKNTKAKVRSAKFLRAVASGKWVVTEAWLQECQRRGGRVKEEAFEVSGDRKSVVPSAPTRSRLAHADPGRPGLFQGISFHFRGEFGTTGSPPLAELQAMLLDNGGRVVTTVASLFTSPSGAGGGGGRGGRGGGGSDGGAGRRSDGGNSGGGSSGSGSGSGSGGWRPRRVVIFQPPSESPEEFARTLEEDLASVSEAELSKQGCLAAEGARARGGGGAGGGGGPDNMAIEVVKPIWLVDSVGCYRVVRPSVHHRLPVGGGGLMA